ncbi:MAG: CehA/McbA family metallohydrolase [Candidatus Dormibacteraeota bacterium]|nr:CehA/McbA family metallohydrolase [Candidatus Dormibacteraeota bacterium]
MARDIRTLRLGLEDLLADEHRSVPFEVPAGTESLEVCLSYDRSAAVIDLGCEGPRGWRGWSGSRRERFVIRADGATPGYVPGALEPGAWSVQVGLRRLPLNPVPVTVTISMPAESTIESEPPAAVRGGVRRVSARRLPAPSGLTWFAGDMHAHTTHSDGTVPVDQLAARAVENGLDFLAVTDHNTVSHHPHLAAAGARHDVALLPGQELTTPRGHANAYGDIGFVDFRRPADQWVQEVAARGGLLSINHPLDRDMCWQHPLTELPPALELWHITWFADLTSTAPWALWARWRQDAVLLGGSDFHRPEQGFPPGTPTTWVAAEERSPEALLAAVAAGRTAITKSADVRAPALLRLEDGLVAIDAEGAVLCDLEGRRRVITGPCATVPLSRAGRGPFRLQEPTGEVLAISR